MGLSEYLADLRSQRDVALSEVARLRADNGRLAIEAATAHQDWKAARAEVERLTTSVEEQRGHRRQNEKERDEAVAYAETLAVALRVIAANAQAWHGDDAAKGRALIVIGDRCREAPPPARGAGEVSRRELVFSVFTTGFAVGLFVCSALEWLTA